MIPNIYFRFIFRVAQTTMFPDDLTREAYNIKMDKKAGDDLLVAWSRSTSASSIYRWDIWIGKSSTDCLTHSLLLIFRNVEHGPKHQQIVSTIGWEEPLFLVHKNRQKIYPDKKVVFNQCFKVYSKKQCWDLKWIFYN